MNSERLTFFSYNHHNTMNRFSGENYNVSTREDGRILVVIDEGFPEEKAFYLADSTPIFDEILAIVKSYKMDKYKESYQPKLEVLDGDSWSLYYKYDTKRNVSSGGYMAWPSNYREMRQALSDYFKKWREKQDGLLIIDYFKFTCRNNQGRDIEYSIERGETENTITIRDTEKGVDKTVKVDNEVFHEFIEMANIVGLKSSKYKYNYTPSDENATFCSYFMRYNSGDTISGSTGYMQYMGQKERAIFDFFSRWLP